MKKIGIWLDKEKAIIVTIDNKTEHVKKIASNIEHYRPHGGSGTRLKGGPQDVVQDKKYLEREKHQFKIYFKSIAEDISDADAIVIFGPAEANQKFAKELNENYNTLAPKIKGVKTADSMTENQVKAWVKDFFWLN